MDPSQVATEISTGIGPLLGPIPTAYLVGDRTMRHLAWPWPIALVAALTLELVGISAAHVSLRLWLYRKEKTKADPPAPHPALGLLLLVLYFVAALTLTVILDIAAVDRITPAHVAPGIFPILSLVSVGLLALKSAEPVAFMNRHLRRASLRQRKMDAAGPAEQPRARVTKSKKEQIINLAETVPVQAEIARRVGVSSQYVSEVLRARRK